MSSDFRIRGIAKPIPPLPPASSKLGQFEEVLKESEQLISEANLKEDEMVSLNPDLSFTIKSISSIYLDANPKFQDLKRTLETYHLDSRRRRPLLHPGKSSQWKQIIYSSLQKLLHECVFTNVRKLQLQYLDKVYDWYYDKVGKENSANESQSIPDVEIKGPEPIEDNENPPDRLSQYSRRQINSAQSLRPKTSNTVQSKIFESRPASAVKFPIQAFTGAGEPRGEIAEVAFESSYISYLPVGEEDEKKAEERFQWFRNKDLSEKRLRDEMKLKVDNWTLLKAKKAEEFNRKFESNRFASRFDQRGYSPSRPHTASEAQFSKEKVFDVIDPEPEAKTELIPEPIVEAKPMHRLSKIETIRKLHEDILEADESIEEPINALNLDPSAVSLSAYSKTAHQLIKAGIRPHTAGYLPPARNVTTRGMNGASRPITDERAQQIDEIYEVKKSLAKKNIPCSIDTLRNALLMPEDLPPEALTLNNFPAPGARLLSNPFLKLGKKAKKGKKKGKKGKKGKKAK